MMKSAQEAAGIAPEGLAKYKPVIGLEVHIQLPTTPRFTRGQANPLSVNDILRRLLS
jgi:Asp-tRNA(Asn)/Glu-tRNA(Gln) amidotransferase B subunit